MKRVLVTGGFGYLGSVIVNALLRENYKVTILDRTADNRPEWSKAMRANQLHVVTGDIRDGNCLKRGLRGAEGVIHLAGISDGRAGRIDPQKTMEVNAGAFEKLVALSKEEGVRRFLFASTFGVYGNEYKQELTEDLAVNPAEPYSYSKALCEQILNKQQSDSFLGVSLRLSMVYGFSPAMRFDFLVNTMVLKALSEGRIRLLGGAQKRPQIHIKDASRYFIQLLRLPQKKILSTIYNAGNENITLEELAEEIVDTLHKPVHIIREPARKTENSFMLNSEKIAAELGLVPGHSIGEAVREMEEKYQLKDWKLLDAV